MSSAHRFPAASGALRPGGRRLGLRLAAASALCFAAAGLLLWWRHGEAIFSDHLLAALAWCF